MFYYSTSSKEKVVHFKCCHHVKNIKRENLGKIDSIYYVRRSEYRICSSCSPIIQHLKKECSTIDEYCTENKLSYFLDNGNLHIKTKYSNWQILVSDNIKRLELHHANTFEPEQENENSVPGYHKQKCKSSTILGYMKYIIRHEKYKILSPSYVIINSPPPRKGTKHWKRRAKARKQVLNKIKVKKVLDLIDNMTASGKVTN